jgi:hypothetical protein
MGDFSRNTFDPTKNYVGVRLQQGVPLVDADWNELNDVARHELYEGFNLAFTDGIQPGGPDLEVLQSSPVTNDFQVEAGTVLVRGRIVHVRKRLRYSTQPWADPKRAVRDGVAVIPPLTTPTGPAGTPPRTDIVYLDVWERKVGSDEDANLINPAIGVETCIRLKREAAVRVAEGTTTLPFAPVEHVFLPLALLHRPANQETITSEQIADNRPFFHSPRGSRVASFFPAFLPVIKSGTAELRPAWQISFEAVSLPAVSSAPKFHVFKFFTQEAVGVLPLILPEGAFLTHLSIRGHILGTNGEVQWQLLRIRHPFITPFQTLSEILDILHEDTILALEIGRLFDISYAIPSFDPAKLIVDNSRYYYALFAQASKQATVPYTASIHGVSIHYKY